MAMRVAVVLLAGGQSRRMGGGDKNLMDLGGKPLLAHILDRVDIAGLPALINANGDAVRSFRCHTRQTGKPLARNIGPRS